MTHEQLKQMQDAAPSMVSVLRYALARLDHLTTEQFSRGEDKDVRDRIHEVLIQATGTDNYLNEYAGPGL